MSYTETTRTKTEKGRLYELGLHQSEVSKLDLKIRKIVSQFESKDTLHSDKEVVSKEIQRIEKTFLEYMHEHSRCLNLITDTDDNYDPFVSGLYINKLRKEIHDFKQKYYEPFQRQGKEEPSEIDCRMQKTDFHVDTATGDVRSYKRSASGRQTTNSRRSGMSIREAALKEKAKLAELKLEATYMKKQEEAIQKQRMLAKELEIAKAEARLKVYEEEDDEEDSRRSSNLTSLPAKSKREIVEDYLARHQTEKAEPEEEQIEPAVQKKEEHPLKIEGQHMSSLIKTLQLPEVEIDMFNGDPLDFWFFMTAFAETVETKTTDPRSRLVRLLKYVVDEPKDLIQSCIYLPSSTCYSEAKRLLMEQYGDSYRILNEYKRQLRSWQKIKPNDSVATKRFYTFIMKFKTTMEATKNQDNQELIQLLHSKLPTYIQDRWNRTALKIRQSEKCNPTLKHFTKMLQEEIKLMTDPLYSRQATESSAQQGDRSFQRKPSLKSFQTNVQVSCPLCSNNHDLDECVRYLQNSVDERRRILYRRHLCFSCYLPISPEHSAKSCTRKRTCKICKREHPTGLHGYIRRPPDNRRSYDSRRPPNNRNPPDQRNPPDNKGNQSSSEIPLKSVAMNRTTTDAVVVSLCVVPVELKYKSRQIKTYALLDNGSEATFIRKELAVDLDVPTAPTSLTIETMIGKETRRCSVVTGLKVTGSNSKNSISLPSCYTQRHIPIGEDEIPTPKKIHRWKHLQHLSRHLPQDGDKIEIGILIGGNCPTAMEPLNVIHSKDNGPYAVETRLGWCITGPMTASNVKHHTNRCNRIAVKNVVTQEVSPHYFSVPDRVIDQTITDQLHRMYIHDFNEKGDNSTSKVSQEDIRFVEVMKKQIRKVNNHYELPLPFRDPDASFVNNRIQASQRAEWLRKKLLRNSKMHEDYKAFMETLLAKGFARRITQKDLDSPPGKVWYLPTFGVYHPKKPDKIRVVLDCSATFKGTSLNKELMQGPDLTNKLLGVLTRFRHEDIAVMADVEAMFYQVQVPEEQQNFLRFLWWPDGELSAQLEEFVMTVHVFGAVSSPSVANFALHATAKEDKENFGSDASETLQRNFYVDDMLKSYATTNNAISSLKEVVQMCAAGGFRLTKVVSNSREVMKAINPEERGKTFKELDLSSDVLPIERALGVHWCIENDSFSFRIELKDQPLTRRGILSTVSSVYDPLGLAAPFLLKGKIILQQLCADKKGWDEDIGQEQTLAWERWRRDLPRLESVSVQRCFTPRGFGSVSNYSLHHFSDASDIAYGQASYLRVENENGDVNCTLLIGKARVAPMKSTTMPRLELTAATVSATVASLLRDELDIEANEFFWTDSEVVLGYLRNEQKRFHLFVANRVQQILNNTKKQQWQHVKSDFNPTDDASRGLTIDAFLKNQRWFKGPQFLYQPMEVIKQINKEVEVDDSDPELKRVNRILIQDEDDDVLIRLTSRNSRWMKLKRIVCTMLKWKTRKPIIEVDDLEKAERLLITMAQRKAFQTEISQLSQGKRITKSSSIYRLDPFLDSNSILRVGGRLKKSSFDTSTVHPVILPRRSDVTTMIVRECHEVVQHSGRGLTINEVRSRGYWVINCNSFVRYLISRCIMCRRLRGQTSQQRMADLPSDRLEESPPFTVCGVDFFGPFIIKEGRKELKRYGCIFTCFATRAVHIESSNTLDTDSFIQALRRFLARRGNVRTMYSDNGTNFVGAQRELQAAIQEMDEEKIQAFLHLHGGDWMSWKRNPPAASHFGGVWERQIRSVRSILNSLLTTHGHALNDEAFRTFLVEAEGIVNSRPLTTDTLSDVHSPLPLAPMNLLTMKSNVVAPPPGCFDQPEIFSRRRWRRIQHLLNEFWSRWRKEYLQNVQVRNKWQHEARSLEVGDVVLLKDANEMRNEWKLFVVEETFPDKDSVVRTVTIRNANGQRFKRPVHKLVVLVETDSPPKSQS